jgi:LacI family transcriptional regulator
VSQSTVSRALRRDPKVTEETQQRVLEVAKRLGYVTNRAARSLKLQRNQAMGLLVADLHNPYFLAVIDGLHGELHGADYRTYLVSERLNTEGTDMVDLLVGSVDGVVVASARTPDDVVLKLADRGLPVALINREVEAREFDRVLSDYSGGGELVARHLVSLGHRRIGLITGPSWMPVFRDREKAFRRVLDTLGAPFDDRLRREGWYSYEMGHKLCTELLEVPERPSAIFAADDAVAFGALDAAHRLGVDVPRELSIIGYNDLAMAGWDRFNLTTIRQPVEEMARDAARMVLQRIDGRVEPGSVQCQVYPAALVRRGSTGPAWQV